MVGTFDVENFGDLLFPLLAHEELGNRLDRPELVLYSYREKSGESWPYDVRSLVRLPDEIDQLDLLVVGGGHLVRFDKEVAPGYEPPSTRIHHPTGYWLAPTLLAACYGVPVAWNAVSTSLDTPDWARGLLRHALEAAAYVSVRDEPSLAELLRVDPDATVELVPDSAFAAARLIPAERSVGFRKFCSSAGLVEPYVVVQPSPHLAGRARQIDSLLQQAHAQGVAILELPISPCLGDEPGILGLTVGTQWPTSWPDPLLLAEIVSRAEAVVTRSLHLSIVALACGVPVHRHRSAPDPKYRALDGFPGIVWWDDGEDPPAAERGIGRRPTDSEVDRQVGRLQTHWDAIAYLAGERARTGAGAQAASDLIALCTSELERLANRAHHDAAVGAERESPDLDGSGPSPGTSRLRAMLGKRPRTPPASSP
jgi:Polysaccharide pyruvyl transferase